MLDFARIYDLAIQAVFWLVTLACNFLGYSAKWAQKGIKQSNLTTSVSVPPHIAVVVTEKDKTHLVEMVEHCLREGVRQVVLYDPFNEIYADALRFKKFCLCHGVRLLIGSEEITPPGGVLTLQVLPSDAGKKNLVKTCKLLSSQTKKITTEDISRVLNDEFCISDPNMLILVGNVPSLCGYPPYNLRLTEFVLVNSIPRSHQAFMNCISAYNQRDIRAGK